MSSNSGPLQTSRDPPPQHTHIHQYNIHIQYIPEITQKIDAGILDSIGSGSQPAANATTSATSYGNEDMRMRTKKIEDRTAWTITAVNMHTESREAPPPWGYNEAKYTIKRNGGAEKKGMLCYLRTDRDDGEQCSEPSRAARLWRYEQLSVSSFIVVGSMERHCWGLLSAARRLAEEEWGGEEGRVGRAVAGGGWGGVATKPPLQTGKDISNQLICPLNRCDLITHEV